MKSDVNENFENEDMQKYQKYKIFFNFIKLSFVLDICLFKKLKSIVGGLYRQEWGTAIFFYCYQNFGAPIVYTPIAMNKY